MRRPTSVPRVRGHALRVVAGAVLVGYLATLSATTTGHGLRLALHLLTEHYDGGHDDHDHDDVDHDVADLGGQDHDHESYIDVGDHGDHDRGPDHDDAHGHDDHDEDAPHAHHGRVHTHHEDPPPPAWLSASLDKHVRPSAHRVPAPRLSRRADVLRPSARPAAIVITVEVPPPRREA